MKISAARVSLPAPGLSVWLKLAEGAVVANLYAGRRWHVGVVRSPFMRALHLGPLILTLVDLRRWRTS